jgi:hypothetical protein
MTVPPGPGRRMRSARFWTGLLLGLALAKGVLNAWSRPWSICDEAGHLEHVLYVASHRRLPGSADLDVALRQRVSDAFHGADCGRDRPGAIVGCLGSQQLEERHAYYAMQALAQALVGPETVLGQLRLARCVSLALLLLSLVVAHATTARAFPDRPLLAVSVTALMATLPSYTGLMTTVNNDSLACLAGALLVLSAVALVRDGPTPRSLVAASLAAGLCFAAKTTSMLLLPAAAAALWLALPLRRRAAHALMAVAVALALLSPIDLRGSAHWLKPRHDHVDRVSNGARLGSHAFRLRPGYALAQRLPPGEVAALRGAQVTLGAWMRAADQDVLAHPPLLDAKTPLAEPEVVRPGREWRFVAWSARVPEEASVLGVRLVGPQSGVVEVDGVALVRGNLAAAAPPQWRDDDARQGSWGGGPARNLLRNGSAERGWPLLREGVDARLPLPFGLNWRLQSLYAWRTTPAYYKKAVDRFLVTFWRSFAWGTPSLRRSTVAGATALATLAVCGLLLRLADAMRRRLTLTSAEIRVLCLLVVTVLIALAGTLARTDPPKPQGHGFVPGARYFFVALLPAAILIVLGLGRWLPRRLRPWGLAALAAWLYLSDLWVG